MEEKEERFHTENFEGDMRIERMKSDVLYDMPQMHRHNYHEIYFLMEGYRRYFIGHTIYDVCPGNMVVIAHDTLHRAGGFKGKHYDRYVVYFSDREAEGLRDRLGEAVFSDFLGRGCIRLPAAAQEKIRELFLRLEQEKLLSDAYSSFLCTNLLHEIIVTALRYGTKQEGKKTRQIDGIQRAAHYISEHFAESITLHDAAKVAYMEDTYFSKQFKKITGFGFREYLVQTRVKTAAEMLRSSDLPLSRIAELCGFSGSNYFGDVFRRSEGVSPLQYRRKGHDMEKEQL